MKKLLITLSIAFLSVCAFAQDSVGLRPMNYKEKQNQFKAQSLDTKVSNGQVSVLWLRDGYSNDYTAVAVPMFKVTGLGNRVNLVAVGAYDSKFTKTNLYVGTGVQVNLVRHAGFSLDVYGAYKGFNLGDNFRAADSKGAFVWGIGVSAPISGN
jgi:hypothetical protein